MRGVWRVHLHLYLFAVILVQVCADADVLRLGQNVTLNCTAANNPPTNIKHVKWTKDGADVASFSLSSGNQVTVRDPSKFDLSLPSYTLTIKSATEQDGGLYNCTVEHTDGNTTSSTIAVAMPVTSAPLGTSTSPRTSTSPGMAVSSRVSTSTSTVPATSTLQTDKPSGTTSSPKGTTSTPRLPVVPRLEPGSTPGIQPPGQPVAVEVNATSIRLSWDASQSNNSKVNYTVYISTSSGPLSKSGTYTTQDTELLVAGLIPKTKYLFLVEATDGEGNSVNSTQSEPISTAPLKPDQKVSNLRGRAENATAIFVSWVGPNIVLPAHIKWGYFLSYREFNSSQTAASNVRLRRDAQNATIVGLLPLTQYQIQVLIYYDFGSGRMVYGEWRRTFTQTAEGEAPVPTIRMNNAETTAYSIGITWTVPSPPVARILGFLIYYCLYSTCPADTRVITVGDVRSYVLTDLEPKTFYMVSMESFNSGSNSSRTKQFPVKTDILPPFRPEQLRVDQLSATCINVSWTQPGLNVRRVESFSLLYSQCSFMHLFCMLPQSQEVPVRDGPVQWYLLQNLKSASPYSLNVTARVRSTIHMRYYVNTSRTENFFLAMPGLTAMCVFGDPCTSYRTIDDPKRSVNYPLSPGEAELCDSRLTTAWYRFDSLAGGQMPTSCVPRYSCGSPGPVWMNGAHPQPGQIARALACTHVGQNCCQISQSIAVKNCGEYFVYNLSRTLGCGMAYCAGTEVRCPPGQTSPTGFTPGCHRRNKRVFQTQETSPGGHTETDTTSPGGHTETDTTNASVQEATVPFTTVVVVAGLSSGFLVSLMVFIVAAVVYRQRADVIYGHQARGRDGRRPRDIDVHRSRDRTRFPHLQQNRLSAASNDYVLT